MAAAIALGATSMNDIALLAHHALVLGREPGDTTVRRTLELADPATLNKIARGRARVRAHVWALIAARRAGFPWLAIAGKVLAGWLVIDLDGTLITARSDKEGAAATFKMGYGFHPLGAWLANTAECWRCCCARATPARCDTRSHKLSGSTERRSADAEGVIPGQCPRPVPALTCAAGNGGVRSSEKTPKGPRSVRGPQARGRPDG